MIMAPALTHCALGAAAIAAVLPKHRAISISLHITACKYIIFKINIRECRTAKKADHSVATWKLLKLVQET